MKDALFIASVLCLIAGVAMTAARSLPAQNIAFIVVLLAAVEGAVELLTRSREWKVGVLLWPGAILLLRALAQALLKSRRRDTHYGLYLIGVASVGATALQAILTGGKGIVLRFGLTAICLVFLAPWFLRKRVTVSEESKG